MTNHPNRSGKSKQHHAEAAHWIASLADTYSIPSELFAECGDDLEVQYRRLREHCQDEYGSRRKIERQALRRSGASDYVQPGINFYMGATDAERSNDRASARAHANASSRLQRAEIAMAEYDAWVAYKYLLAILTGRYDGAELKTATYSGQEWATTANADVARAHELRRPLI
jgi:hypothetical protein